MRSCPPPRGLHTHCIRSGTTLPLAKPRPISKRGAGPEPGAAMIPAPRTLPVDAPRLGRGCALPLRSLCQSGQGLTETRALVFRLGRGRYRSCRASPEPGQARSPARGWLDATRAGPGALGPNQTLTGFAACLRDVPGARLSRSGPPRGTGCLAGGGVPLWPATRGPHQAPVPRCSCGPPAQPGHPRRSCRGLYPHRPAQHTGRARPALPSQ